MNNPFVAYRAERRAAAAEAKAIASGTVPPDIARSYTNFMEESINPFLERYRKRTPGLLFTDKVSMAMNLAGAVYLPITFAARQFSRSKVVIYQHDYSPKDLDGKKRVPRADRPMYRMFDLHPNPRETFNDLLYQQSRDYDLTGECFVWCPPVDSDGNYTDYGEPAELYCLPSAWVNGLPAGPWFTEGYYALTPYITSMGGPTPLGAIYVPAEQVIRVYDPHPLLDRSAMSVLQAVSQAIDTVRSIDQSRISAQNQGCQQNLALELDPQFWMQGSQFDINVVKERFHQVYAGARNAGKALVLPPGVIAKKVSTVPEDMEWQEGWTQITDFLWAAFHTNRAALGMNSEVNFATLLGAVKQLMWSKLSPRTEQFAASYNKFYFSPYIGEEYFMELELPVLEDEEHKLRGLALDLKCGARTIGEYRMARGLSVDPDTHDFLDERAWEGKQSGAEVATDEHPDGMQDGDVEKDRPQQSQPPGRAIRNSERQTARSEQRVDEEKLLAVLDRNLSHGRVLNGRHK